jgi:DHA1 family multidrug resistance protein-like MFS transporter
MTHDDRQLAAGTPSLNWRRNLYVVWLAEVLALMGFDAVLPFLPYYVEELGVSGPGQVELWSGLVFSAHALTMGILSPIWGSLADRLGRKMMVERAMFGGAVLLGAMSLVSNVQQLVVLRMLQGAVTGTVAASFSLVAAGTPQRDRAYALGMLQMGVYLGGSLGPTVGGFVADLWGYRACFVITAALLAIGGVLVTALVREARSDLIVQGRDSFAGGMSLVLRSPGVLSVFALRFLVSAALRTANPMLPLFVQWLAPAETRVASVVGVIDSANMATTAVGAMVAGRYGSRLDIRRTLAVCLLGAAVFTLLQGVARSPGELLACKALAGLAIGGILVALNSALTSAAPADRQGTVFGLQASVQSVANAAGPMLGGVIAAAGGLRLPFVAAGLGLALGLGLLAAQDRHRSR